MCKRGHVTRGQRNSREEPRQPELPPCGAEPHLQGAPAARRRAGRRPPTAPRARSPRPRPAAVPAEPGPGPRPSSTRRRRPSLSAEGRYLTRAHPPPEVGGRQAGRTDRRTRRHFRSGGLREVCWLGSWFGYTWEARGRSPCLRGHRTLRKPSRTCLVRDSKARRRILCPKVLTFAFPWCRWSNEKPFLLSWQCFSL